ncbi:hypothetical protein BDR06DRAFT_1002378 [Suillus hirtellus]|nr:hypothetical protein BDR06DRAFT_1002378 [Suillus hirtellus]
MILQGWDPRRDKPKQRKIQVDCRSTTSKKTIKPPTRHTKNTNSNQNWSSSHLTIASVTSAKNKSNKKLKVELEHHSDTNASETNSLLGKKNINATDDNQSEIDSLFDYDGSGEEADEEADDSDVNIYST